MANWLKAIKRRKHRMKTKARGKADPIERQIESAFRPGTFIRDGECISFVSRLEEVAATIDTLVASEPARAVALYETLLAGCHSKADELDDSSGSFRAICAGSHLPLDQVPSRYGRRPADDPLPPCSRGWTTTRTPSGTKLRKDAAAAFDKAGLAAFREADPPTF